MRLILEQMPVQRVLIMPLVPLAQLCPHKGKLFARMGKHIGIEGTDTGELLVVFTRHFSKERAFHVDYFIMGKREYIIF